MNEDSNDYNGLSRIMKARYNSLYHRYKDRTITLLSLLSGSGGNSYSAFVVKSDAVNNSSGSVLNYYRSVTEAFTANTPYEMGQITQKICALRSRFKLEPFTGRNLNAMCLKELCTTFLVKTQLKETDGVNHKVYVPVFALLS